MNQVLLVYSKESKNLVKKLTSRLETDGFNVWVEPRDVPAGKDGKSAILESIEQSGVMILLYSVNADKSEDIMDYFQKASDLECPVIPFIISDVTLSVSMQHFLNTHDWINGFDRNFDEAYEDLKDLITEYLESSGQSVKKEPKPKKNSPKKEPLNPKIKNYLIIGALAVLVFILGVVMFWEDESDNPDTLIVGTWKLVNYKDNYPRTKDDSVVFLQTIISLKQNFKLIMYQDKNFERFGFAPTVEKGKWEYDQQKKILFLQPLNMNQRDQITVRELTDNKLVFVVAEKADSLQVITELTLQKQ